MSFVICHKPNSTFSAMNCPFHSTCHTLIPDQSLGPEAYNINPPFLGSIFKEHFPPKCLSWVSKKVHGSWSVQNLVPSLTFRGSGKPTYQEDPLNVHFEDKGLQVRIGLMAIFRPQHATIC